MLSGQLFQFLPLQQASVPQQVPVEVIGLISHGMLHLGRLITKCIDELQKYMMALFLLSLTQDSLSELPTPTP